MDHTAEMSAEALINYSRRFLRVRHPHRVRLKARTGEGEGKNSLIANCSDKQKHPEGMREQQRALVVEKLRLICITKHHLTDSLPASFYVEEKSR